MADLKELLATLKEAIEDEKQAQKKYKKLKEQTDSQETAKLYEQLIADEKEHERLLRSRYEALKESLDE